MAMVMAGPSPEALYTSVTLQNQKVVRMVNEAGKAVIAVGSRFPKTKRNRDASIVRELPKHDIDICEKMYVRIDFLHEIVNKIAEFVFHAGTRVKSPAHLREDQDFDISKIPGLKENIKFVRQWSRYIKFNSWSVDMFKVALWGGNAYSEVVYDKESPWKISYLKLIKPQEMRVIRDETGEVLGYVQFPKFGGLLSVLSRSTANEYKKMYGKSVVFFEPNEIVHLKWDALPGEAYGVSMFESLKDSTAIVIGMREDMPIIVRNNAAPTILFKIGTDLIPASKETIEDFGNYLEEYYGTDTNLVASSLVTHETIDTSSKVIDLPAYIKVANNMLYAGAGVPEILLGQGNETTEATAKQQLESVEKKFRSMQQMFKDAVELQVFSRLIKESGDAELTPDDMDQIPELFFPAIESTEDKRLRLENGVKNGSITHEEYRKEFGLTPKREGTVILAEDREFQKEAQKSNQALIGSTGLAKPSNTSKTNKTDGKPAVKKSDRDDKRA